MRWTHRLLCISLLVLVERGAHAADHRDGPATIADPASDLADVYAWTSADGARLNLVMTVPAAEFSDATQYVFHVGSGNALGVTGANYSILCRFDAAQMIECWAGDADDYVIGDASDPAGLVSMGGRFRVFAGLRNDPFFFNLDGFTTVLDMAKEGVEAGAIDLDVAACPILDTPTANALVRQLRTEPGGGPAVDDFAGMDVGAIVVSIDLPLVTRGGNVIAVWGATYAP